MPKVAKILNGFLNFNNNTDKIENIRITKKNNIIPQME